MGAAAARGMAPLARPGGRPGRWTGQSAGPPFTYQSFAISRVDEADRISQPSDRGSVGGWPMRLLALFLVLFAAAGQALAQVDAVLPKVSFSATAVEEAGAQRVRQTVHYSDGRLRIDGPTGGTHG